MLPSIPTRSVLAVLPDGNGARVVLDELMRIHASIVQEMGEKLNKTIRPNPKQKVKSYLASTHLTKGRAEL